MELDARARTHDTGVINNGVIRLFKLVQPVRNKAAAKLTKTTELYTGKINSTRFILQNLKIQRL
jgi:hypothetical protein